MRKVLSFGFFAGVLLVLLHLNAAALSSADNSRPGSGSESAEPAIVDASGRVIIPGTEIVSPDETTYSLPPPKSVVPPPQPGCMTTELQMAATASRSGGGSGTYGPQRANDGIGDCFDSPPSGPGYCWISAGSSPGGAWYQLLWTSPQEVCEFWVDTVPSAGECASSTGRGLSAATFQYWSGTAWVSDGSTTMETEDWGWKLRDCATTTRVRLYNLYCSLPVWQQSNPVLWELRVRECIVGTPTPVPSATPIPSPTPIPCPDCFLLVEAKLDDDTRFTSDVEAAFLMDNLVENGRKLDVLEGKFDTITVDLDPWFDQLYIDWIKTNLEMKVCTDWMYKPEYVDLGETEYLGGKLELVFAVIQSVIDEARMVECPDDGKIDKAQCLLNYAIATANDRPPLDCHSICGHLIKAYDNATGHPNNSGACDSASKK